MASDPKTGVGGRRRPAVMADVAKLAGVSQMTVSRVLNNQTSVRPSTRARVLAAMAELDYRPNTAARTLVTGRSSVVGVVSFDATLYGPASTLAGIEEAAREAGYSVSVASLRSMSTEAIAEAVERLTVNSVVGIIVIAPHRFVVDGLAGMPHAVPLVAVQGPSAGPVPTVSVDQGASVGKAMGHLLELGHEAIWHIAGPEGWLEARGREEAWRAELIAAGHELPPVLKGDWSARSGYEQARRIVADGTASAVFVANDHMALGALRAFGEAGLRVPEDISVVGFDDVPEAAYLMPPLTTVRADFNALGRRSLLHLLDVLEDESEQEPGIVLQAELVVRESTGPAPRRRRRRR